MARIGEVAKQAGVSTSRIRFYERSGLIPRPARTANGYRDYPAGLVAVLRFVELAQDLGFTLREIAAVHPAEGDLPVSCDEALRLLDGKLRAVSALISQAQDRRRRILATMDGLRAHRDANRDAASRGAACRADAGQDGAGQDGAGQDGATSHLVAPSPTPPARRARRAARGNLPG